MSDISISLTELYEEYLKIASDKINILIDSNILPLRDSTFNRELLLRYDIMLNRTTNIKDNIYVKLNSDDIDKINTLNDVAKYLDFIDDAIRFSSDGYFKCVSDYFTDGLLNAVENDDIKNCLNALFSHDDEITDSNTDKITNISYAIVINENEVDFDNLLESFIAKYKSIYGNYNNDIKLFVLFKFVVSDKDLFKKIIDFNNSNTNFSILYFSYEFTDYKIEYNNNIEMLKSEELIDNYYCLVFDDNWIEGLEDFIKNPKYYKPAFDTIIDRIQKQSIYGKNRFVILHQSNTAKVKGIEFLLAWISLYTSYIFIFEDEIVGDRYHKFIENILKCDKIFGDSKLKIFKSTDDIVRDENGKVQCWKFGMTNLNFDTSNEFYPSPVVVLDRKITTKRTGTPIPLDSIYSEILCSDFDFVKKEYTDIVGSTNFSFYNGKPILSDEAIELLNTIFNSKDITIRKSDDNIIDTLISEFIIRCEIICTFFKSVKVINSDKICNSLISKYDIFDENCNVIETFLDFLYSFEIIFSYYASKKLQRSRFYTLSDLVIVDAIDKDGNVKKFVVPFDYELSYKVSPIVLVNNKPFANTNINTEVNYVYSPLYLYDFYVKQYYTDTGIEYGKINNVVLDIVDLIKTRCSRFSNNIQQLETSVNNNNGDDDIDISSYLINMPVINGTLVQFNTDDIDIFIANQIIEFYERFYGKLYINNRTFNIGEIDNLVDTSIIKTDDYKLLYNKLRSFVNTGLSEVSAINDKKLFIDLYNEDFINISGIRYLKRSESPILWNGKLCSDPKSGNKSRISLAIFKRRNT